VRQAIVVDDSRAIRLILGKLLREVGYEVAEAGDGREALGRIAELAVDRPVSLALVDWNMPEMNGIDLVRAVRANAAYNDLRIVMVTTETEMSHVAMALEAGADEYLMKPFTKDAMLGKLELLGQVHS
jgi:two-component system chemotaxis response regulator CheY